MSTTSSESPPTTSGPSLDHQPARHAKLGDVRPHDLPHSYGSILLDKGVPLPGVSKLLGHANVQTTARIYAGVVEGREQHTSALVDAAFARSGDHEVTTEDTASSPQTTEMHDYQGVS